MRSTYFRIYILTIVLLTMFSCEKFSDIENEENAVTNSTLTIRTRVDGNLDGDNPEVSYPVNIYVFDSRNVCVAVTEIPDGESDISMNLSEGNYNVYAVAGADSQSYDLPTKDTASKTSVIALKPGMSHGDLMTAHNTVSLEYNEVNTLTLSLERKVMLLQEVEIYNVPSSVTAVSVNVMPLYENLLLDGSYSGENGSQTVELVKEDESSSTWKNSCNVYLLESSNNVTIKVSFTNDHGTNSYSYSSNEDFVSNYKFRIDGTYVGSDMVLQGSITGTAWEGTKDIVFSFDENGSTTEEESGEDKGNNDEGASDAPEADTFYEGYYVLTSEKSDGKTTVLLMSTSEEKTLTFENGNEESIKAAIDAGIAELGTESIPGWRLPTLSELLFIADDENYSRISDNLVNNGYVNFSKASNTYYYFLSDEGAIQAYCLYSKATTNPASNHSSQHLRAFATVTFPR